MKRMFITVIVLFSIFSTTFAQGAFSIYSGVGRSSFDKEVFGSEFVDLAEFTQAQYIPLGGQVTYSLPFLLTFGVEVNYAIAPYTFEISADINNETMKVAELKVNQLYAGLLVKARLLPGPIVPYARAGAGLVSGDIDLNWDSQFRDLAAQAGFQFEDSTISVKSAIGVNLGGGVEINFSESGGLFGEIVYYFIQREKEIQGTESFQANNYALQVGWQFKF